jgi:hypothetical protein
MNASAIACSTAYSVIKISGRRNYLGERSRNYRATRRREIGSLTVAILCAWMNCLKFYITLACSTINISCRPGYIQNSQLTHSPGKAVNRTGKCLSDPVGPGFVASLAHPGGNITGFGNFEPAIGGNWLELLKEIAPGVTRVALLFGRQRPISIAFSRAQNQATSRCRRRPSSSWSSTSRPRRRSASLSRSQCSRARTKLSNEAPANERFRPFRSFTAERCMAHIESVATGDGRT